MVVVRKGIGSIHGTLACGDLTCKSTSQFKYLCIIVTGRNDVRIEKQQCKYYGPKPTSSLANQKSQIKTQYYYTRL